MRTVNGRGEQQEIAIERAIYARAGDDGAFAVAYA